jgi:hypothetical protein
MPANPNHPNRKSPNMDKPFDLYAGVYKRIVRIRRISHKPSISWVDCKRFAMNRMPWFPSHFDSLRGSGAANERVGSLENPGYFGSTRTHTLENYRVENRNRLDVKTQAQCVIADEMISRGGVWSREQLDLMLAMTKRSLPDHKRRQLEDPLVGYIYIFSMNNTVTPETKLGLSISPLNREKGLQTGSNGQMYCSYMFPYRVAKALESQIVNSLAPFACAKKREIFSYGHKELEFLIDLWLKAQGHPALDKIQYSI